MDLQQICQMRYGRELRNCSNEEIYYALLEMVQSLAKGRKKNGNTDSKRKLYYISAEFLIGKLLSNNLINLGIYDEIKQMLAANGKDINEIEDAVGARMLYQCTDIDIVKLYTQYILNEISI